MDDTTIDTSGSVLSCPECDRAIVGSPEYCPECFGKIGGEGGRVVETSAARVSVATDTPALCPHHPDQPAQGTCSRCGAFLCVSCNPKLLASDDVLCMTCLGREAESEAVDESLSGYRVVGGLTAGWAGLTTIGIMVGANMGGAPVWFAVLVGAIYGGPGILAGVLTWRATRRWLAWVCVAYQGLLWLMTLGNVVMNSSGPGGGVGSVIIPTIVLISSAAKSSKLPKPPPTSR